MRRYGTTLARSLLRMMCVAAVAITNQPAFAAPIPGHVEAWGANFFGEAAPPAGLNDVVAIAAGATPGAG